MLSAFLFAGLTVTTCWLPTAQVGVVEAEESLPPEIADLFSMLSIRDRALLPIQVGFQEWSVPGRTYDGVTSPPDATGTQRVSGWTWWNGRDIRTEFDAHTAGTRVAVTSDGLTAHSLMIKANVAGASEWPAVRTIERGRGSFIDGGFAANFGYGYLGASWPYVRSVSSRFVVLGREDVLGRSCLKVGLEYGGAHGSPKHIPMDVWFDDRDSLLALRVQIYQPAHQAQPGDGYSQEDLRTMLIRRDDLDVVPLSRWEVLQVGIVAGRTVPLIGRLTTFGQGVEDVARVVALDRERMQFNAPPPEISTDLPPGGLHVDTIKDLTYIAAGNGKALTNQQRTYVTELETLGVANPATIAALDAGNLDFSKHSCGDYAAQMILNRFGIWTDVETLHSMSGVPLKGREPLNLAEVMSLIRSQGLSTVAVTSSLRELSTWNDVVIVHTTRANPGDESPLVDGHYMLVRVSPDGQTVTYVNPPEPRRVASAAEFESIWTGHALLVARDSLELQRFVDRSARPDSIYIVGLGLAAIGIVILIVGILRTRGRGGLQHAA